jgi:hypothetical protein
MDHVTCCPDFPTNLYVIAMSHHLSLSTTTTTTTMNDGMSQIVFKGPVRSGYWVLRDLTETETG